MPRNGDNLINVIKKELLEFDLAEEDDEYLQLKFKALHTNDIIFITFNVKLYDILLAPKRN